MEHVEKHLKKTRHKYPRVNERDFLSQFFTQTEPRRSQGLGENPGIVTRPVAQKNASRRSILWLVSRETWVKHEDILSMAGDLPE